MEGNEPFEYTYSGQDQREIRGIREKYLPQTAQESKLERLRRLDRSVSGKAAGWSIAVGILGTLIMGMGMSFCLAITEYFAAGIVIGVAGMLVIALAYPMYIWILKKEKDRVAPEILRLTEELMQE